jgi:hypothetical protein
VINNKWIVKALALMPLLILQGCGPGGGGSNEAPKIIDIQTFVHAYSEHEADTNMTMTAYFHVEDANGIDDIDYARVTFPSGTSYKLSATNRLFERNGAYYMRGHFYMLSTGGAGEQSFPMHGYKVELVDKTESSASRIFSVTKEGGAIAPTGNRIVHPDSYNASLQNAIPAFSLPIVHEVTVYSDGVLIDAEVTDTRTGEIEFYFLDQDQDSFGVRLLVDTSVMTIPGRQVYSIPANLIDFDQGFDLSDINYVGAATYDAGRSDNGPLTLWSWMGSSSALLAVTGGDFSSEPMASTEGDNTGIVMDSLIQGVSFSTTSGVSGVTNDQGQFTYDDGDYITFSLGSLVLPEIKAKPVITLLDIFDTQNIHEAEVTNLARLLQTLDDDGSYASVITIPQTHVAVLTSQNVTLTDLSIAKTDFDSTSSISDMVFNLPGIAEMVSQEIALEHLANSLASSEIVDSDGDSSFNHVDEDDDNDGVLDDDDAFPWDPLESADYDGDGVGDNSDTDKDGDGVLNAEDEWMTVISKLPEMPEITQMKIAPELGLMFFTHKGNNSLSIVSLSSLEVEKELTFAKMPNRMYLSKDLNTLYVALMDQEFDTYADDAGSGSVAIIDIPTKVTTKTVPVSVDPYDLVATSLGDIVVTSGSSQWTDIHRYDSGTNILKSTDMIREKSSLALSPDEQTVYGSYRNSTEIYSLTGGLIESDGYPPYNDGFQMKGEVWSEPTGNYLISARPERAIFQKDANVLHWSSDPLGGKPRV